MSDEVRLKVKTNQTLLEKVIPQPLEKFITAALAKLKYAWSGKSTMSGIQFYGDMDE